MGVKVSSFESQERLGRLNCAAGYSRPVWTSTAQVHFLGNRGGIRRKDHRHAPQDQGDCQRSLFEGSSTRNTAPQHQYRSGTLVRSCEGRFTQVSILHSLCRENPKYPLSANHCQRSLRRMTAAPSCSSNYPLTIHCISSTRPARRAHQNALSMPQEYANGNSKYSSSHETHRASSSSRRKNSQSTLA